MSRRWQVIKRTGRWYAVRPNRRSVHVPNWTWADAYAYADQAARGEG